MTLPQIIGSSLYIFGYVLYIRSTLKSTTTPNLASWGAWLTNSLCGFLILLQTSTSKSFVYLATIDITCASVIILSSLRTGLWSTLPTYQKLCALFAVIGALLTTLPIPKTWAIIALSLTAISYIPAAISAFTNQSKEPLHIWFIWCVALLVSLYSVSSTLEKPSDLIFPIISTTSHLAVLAAIFIGLKRSLYIKASP